MGFYEISAIVLTPLVIAACAVLMRRGMWNWRQTAIAVGMAALFLAAQMVASYYPHQHRVTTQQKGEHVCSHSHSRSPTEIAGIGSHPHSVDSFDLARCDHRSGEHEDHSH